MFGNGKTALKVAFNKYLLGQTLNGLGRNPNPVLSLVTTANRTWNDRGGLGINGDYVPQCDLAQPARQRRVRRRSRRPAFGTDGRLATCTTRTSSPGSTTARRTGSSRPACSTKSLPRIVARRRLLPPRLGPFPGDRQPAARRPRTSPGSTSWRRPTRACRAAAATRSAVSTTWCPAKFGQVRNLNALSDEYGNQFENWNGVDVTVNARLKNGLTLQARLSAPARRWRTTARSSAKLPEMNNIGVLGAAPNTATTLPASWRAGRVLSPRVAVPDAVQGVRRLHRPEDRGAGLRVVPQHPGS